MVQKLRLLICEAFEREAKEVIKPEEFENVEVITYPASKLHLRMGWDGIIERINSCEEDTDIIFLGGGCLIGLGPPPEEVKRCFQFYPHQCLEIFINKSIIETLREQGAYLIAPCWLKVWIEQKSEYGFQRDEALSRLKQTNSKLVLLDTGVYENILEDLQNFAKEVKLPYEVFPIGLDYFRILIKNIILEWHLKQRMRDHVNQKVGELLSALNIEITPSIDDEEKAEIVILKMGWDDKFGPILLDYFPPEIYSRKSLEEIGFQLFNGVEFIFGRYKIHKGQGILVNIENIKKQGYIYFDAIPDPNVRGGEQAFMLGVIAPNINYFESLRIKELLKEISIKIKENLEWNIESCYKKVASILTTPIL